MSAVALRNGALSLTALLAACSAQPEHAVEVVDTTIQADATPMNCPETTVALQLAPGMSGGTIQILAPVMDTDGMNSRVYAVKTPMCLPVADLVKLGVDAGLHHDEKLPLSMGYDPLGRLDNFRDRLIYEPMPDELAETPLPANDLKFGEGDWSSEAVDRTISISWYGRDEFVKKYRTENIAGSIGDSDQSGAGRGNSYSAEYDACVEKSGGVTSNMHECTTV